MSLLGIGALLGGIAGLGSLGSSIGFGIAGAQSSKEAAEIQSSEAARQFDAQLAWEQEKFKRQVELLNTAHQREVEDLVAAGLNPVLSATGGNGAGSTVSGGSAHPTASATTPDTIAAYSLAQQGINSALDSGFKSVQTFANAAASEAKAAKDLQSVAESRDLTPARKELLSKQSDAAAAGALDHLANAHNLAEKTPSEVKYLDAKVSNAEANTQDIYHGMHIRDRKLQMDLTNSAYDNRFKMGILRTNQVNAGMNVFNGVVNALKPFNFGERFFGPDDFTRNYMDRPLFDGRRPIDAEYNPGRIRVY